MSGDAGMRATEGMGRDGEYDAHSEYQRETARTGIPLLRDAVEAVGPAPDGWTVVDYGAGTGANSAAAFRAAIEAYRALDPSGPVMAVHADLATNDWNTLFADVTGPDGYLGLGGTILPTAVGADFFGPCLLPGSVHLGMSFNAAHWLSRLPRVHAPGALYFDRVHGAARESLARAADADWRRFLASRASELVPDGRLLVQCVGAVPSPSGGVRASAGALLALMQEVAAGLVADGALSQDALDAYVLPVYARTVSEATRPLDEGEGLGDLLEIEVAEAVEVPSPYEAALARTGDAASYAASYAAFVRGFSESSLRLGLFDPGARSLSGAELADRFFIELERRMAAEPGRHAFEDWTLTVLLRRRSTP